MKRSNKMLILIIMLIGIFLLTGCDKFSFNTFDASKEETNTDKNADMREDAIDSGASMKRTDETLDTKGTLNPGTEDAGIGEVTSTPEAVQPTANMDLSVYTINEDGNMEPVIALIPKDSEITPQLVIDTVIESLADHSIMIGVKDVTTKDDIVIVNFEKDKTPEKNNMGDSYESAILDAIAQSLIDNLKDYNKVIFRIDDKAYVSGVFEKGIDEVYLGDN